MVLYRVLKLPDKPLTHTMYAIYNYCMENNMKKITALFPVTALLFMPTTARAGAPDLTYVESIVVSLQELIVILIPLVIAIGLLFFIWGIVQFILASGNEEAKDAGKRRMVWGIITLFVIVSVWGLVGLLNQLTGIEQGMEVILPDLPF